MWAACVVLPLDTGCLAPHTQHLQDASVGYCFDDAVAVSSLARGTCTLVVENPAGKIDSLVLRSRPGDSAWFPGAAFTVLPMNGIVQGSHRYFCTGS
jgi:hypothetical protein